MRGIFHIVFAVLELRIVISEHGGTLSLGVRAPGPAPPVGVGSNSYEMLTHYAHLPTWPRAAHFVAMAVPNGATRLSPPDITKK
jgi:hypothetical protein